MRRLLGLAVLLASCASSPRPETIEVTLPAQASSAADAGAKPYEPCAPPELTTIDVREDRTVDVAAVQKAMKRARAYAQTCCRGGASGTVRVVVDFAPAGWQTEVTLEPDSFDDADTRGCVVGSFRRVSVRAYEGAPLHFEQTVTIKP